MKQRQTGNAKVIILIGALVVVAAGILYMGGVFPPADKDVSGTIVPAERYRGDSIETGDIVLGDESIAQFMQTDTFEYLMDHPSLVDALNNQGFRDALNNQGFRDALNNQGFRDALNNQGFRDALNNSLRNNAR